MADFVNPHKVVVQRNAFSAFPNTWNEAESKGGAESEKLRRQFSQMDRDMNLQKIFKWILISKKKTLKMIMMKGKKIKKLKSWKKWFHDDLFF